MRFLGQLTNGIQEDIYAGIPPELLQDYLDVDGETHAHIPGTTGAGATSEDAITLSDSSTSNPINIQSEDDTELDGLSGHEIEVLTFLWQQLQSERAKHVRHPPVAVPQKVPPFHSDEMVGAFLDVYAIAKEDQFIPAGYGVQVTEWEEGTYPEEQYIGGDRKLSPSLLISLPHDIWYPWAKNWALGLHIMNTMIDSDM
jgi:hypothetical protein